LEKLVRGEISVEEAEGLLRLLSIEEVENIARVDVSREARKGVPEIVLAQGKSAKDVRKIVVRVLESQNRVIISRVTPGHAAALTRISTGEKAPKVEVHEKARVIVVRKSDTMISKTGGKIGVIAAGTSDIPVAEEAKVVAEEMGCQVLTAYDVGVAGIHRLFPPLKRMLDEGVDVLIVVAGMEGALPSIVTGLVDVPVIGLPTSTGYGLAGGGVGALISMLQTCSPSLSVVNIDNGVGAGATAALIANKASKRRER